MFIQTLKPLTNYDITKLANELKIKNFRGVFMRDTLPDKINEIECGVVNLDLNKNTGTHWVCYYKNKDTSYYFDSFKGWLIAKGSVPEITPVSTSDIS